jgi:hypothetical protein
MTGTTPGALIGHDLFHCAVILNPSLTALWRFSHRSTFARIKLECGMPRRGLRFV